MNSRPIDKSPPFVFDVIKPLLASEDEAVVYFAERDLLGRDVGPIEGVWALPEVERIVKKQRPDGSWKPGKSKPGSGWKYELLETWRHLRFLVDQYEMKKTHPAARKACEFVFSCQSEEGDFRGILANQYAPYYTGALLSLLIKAGYEADPRIEKGMEWLLSMRQEDGGWVCGSPGMVDYPWKRVCELTSRWTARPETSFDWKRPFSAAATGMAIRALAAHPRYRHTEAARKAAALLASKFLRKDNWSFFGHPDNWVRFQFPYWWNHLVSALDACSLIGMPKDDEDIARGLQWLINHQEKDGLWLASYSKIHKCGSDAKSYKLRLWISLRICSVFRRYAA